MVKQKKQKRSGPPPAKGARARGANVAAVENQDGLLEWKQGDKPETWLSAVATIWTTTCGRYRVYRIAPTNDEPIHFGACRRYKDGWWSVENDPKLGSGYARHYRTLEEAFDVAEADHAKRSGVAFTSNRETILVKARKDGLCTRRAAADAATTTGTSSEPKTRQAAANARQTRVPGSGSSLDEQVLAILTDEPKSPSRLADELGWTRKPYDVSLRLVARGLARKTPDGYVRAGGEKAKSAD